jgi:hypothetical protein
MFKKLKVKQGEVTKKKKKRRECVNEGTKCKGKAKWWGVGIVE